MASPGVEQAPVEHEEPLAGTRPYKPSSGSEGMWFMDHFCDACERDRAFRDGTGDSCPIAADTMVYKITDPDYPKEWVRRGVYVECTAYQPELAGSSAQPSPTIVGPAPNPLPIPHGGSE